MKTINAYWDTTEFDHRATQYAHCMKPVRHFLTFEVDDNATQEEIEATAHRKDVKLLTEIS